MMDFFNGCSTNSSCDVLTLIILLWILTSCGIFGGKKHRCECDHGHRDKCRCTTFNIDICTIIILFVIFGGRLFKC